MMVSATGFADKACEILHNMALEYERPWWKRVFGRWAISDEPLRNDAANLLREYKVSKMMPAGTRYVGE